MRGEALLRGGVALAALSLSAFSVVVACSSSDGGASSEAEAGADVPDTGALDSGVVDDGSPCPHCVKSVSAGSEHTCALLGGGTVRCWGGNWDGELGSRPTGSPRSHPTEVPGLVHVTEIAAGGRAFEDAPGYTCARLENGNVVCWGGNSSQVLGRADAKPGAWPEPAPVVDVQNATTISTGESHACATNADGNVMCWGSNTNGELGRSTPDGSAPPGSVSPLAPAAGAQAGRDFTCMLLRDGTVACVGDNSMGSLGLGDAGGSVSTPTVIPGLQRVTSLVVRDKHACALVASTGAVHCWGSNRFGELGRRTVASDPSPLRADLPLDRKAIAIGSGEFHVCAVLDDQSLWCWGSNEFGQVGGDPADAGWEFAKPVRVTGIPGGRILQIVAGLRHTCILLEGGTLQCWGTNDVGQLGRTDPIPDAGNRPQPFPPRPVEF